MVLRIVAWVLRIFGWVILVLGLLSTCLFGFLVAAGAGGGALGGRVPDNALGPVVASGVLGALVVWVLGTLYTLLISLPLIAYGDLVFVILGIEARTKELEARMTSSGRPSAPHEAP